MTNKKTKRDYFNELLNLTEVKSNGELVDFINRELENLDKKNSNRKPTATQKANAELKTTILDSMLFDTAYMVKDILQLECCKGLSSQKVTPIMRSLFSEGLVTNEKIKGTSYYTKIQIK